METTASKIARYVLGAAMILFGANKFGHFITPPPHAPEAEALLSAMGQSGYLMDMVGAVELICGLALVSGYFVPLALIVLAPVCVNFVALHLFLDPAGIGPGAFLASLNLFLGIKNLRSYEDLLMPR